MSAASDHTAAPATVSSGADFIQIGGGPALPDGLRSVVTASVSAEPWPSSAANSSPVL